MVSKLIKKDYAYICSECRMRQPRLQDTCWWCGNLFSNFEEVLMKDFKENMEEALKNEGNIRGRD